MSAWVSVITYSTLTALLEATSDWSVNIDNGHINGLVFIDLKNSFDTIDHQIVLRKLKIYWIDQNSLIWFQSNLTNRTQKSQINSKLLNSAPITCGVPQGSNLRPFFFLPIRATYQIVLMILYPRCLLTILSISYAAPSVGNF